MKIRHKENGIEFIRANGEVVSLTLNEAYEIYHEIDTQNIRDAIIRFIKFIDDEDWCFDITKEEVLADEELMQKFFDMVNYEGLDENDEEHLWVVLERYLD